MAPYLILFSVNLGYTIGVEASLERCTETYGKGALA